MNISVAIKSGSIIVLTPFPPGQGFSGGLWQCRPEEGSSSHGRDTARCISSSRECSRVARRGRLPAARQD